MVDVHLDPKDHRVHLKVDAVLTVKETKDLIKILRNSLRRVDK